MSDLSRSLVDAAAAAIGAAVHMPGSRAQAQEAVAAVLETLAGHIADQPVELVDLIGHGIPFNQGKSSVVDLMRRLAAEVKEVDQ